jgi:hypothetical protein
LSSRSIDKAMLAKTPRWLAGDRWRDGEDGVEDIVEVETVDLGRLEGEWDEEVAVFSNYCELVIHSRTRSA